MESLPPAWRRDLDVALLPGFGERAPRAADLRPAALAEMLLDRWCPPDGAVVLVGHSASCQIVAEAARRRPDRVAGLVLVGPTTDPRRADVRESVRGSRYPVLATCDWSHAALLPDGQPPTRSGAVRVDPEGH